MEVDLDVPDHTTLSRRSSSLDVSLGVEITGDLEEDIQSVTADAAYDTRPIYDAAEAKGAAVVVPPSSKASAKRRGRRSAARDRTIKRAEQIGRRRWKKESGYHQQGRVENSFYRFKTVIGGRLRARTITSQKTEAAVACNVLNRMRAHGWPASVEVAR